MKTLRPFFARVNPDHWRESLADIMVGGSWARQLDRGVQENLRWFWWDGLFAAASDKIIITYLTVYILALGATRAQIGYMSSLSSLVAALALLPGAILVERLGHRKQITMFAGGGLGRFTLLVLALLPFFGLKPVVVYLAMGLAILRDALGNLGFPAWVSMTGALVPLEGRGRYFGSRNFIMGLASMVVAISIGELITRMGTPGGYQAAFGLAFLLGAASTFSWSRLTDPAGNQPTERSTPLHLSVLFRELRQQRAFLALTVAGAFWNFSLNIAGPFFSVFQVEGLGSNATWIGISAVSTSIGSLVAQRQMGALADRWGSRRLQLLTGLMIPFLPLTWAFMSQPWHPAAANFFGGILWAGYSLAGFNLLLKMTPDEQRARYSAINQIVVLLSLALGAAVGSLVIEAWGYPGVFICSAIGRMVSMGLYARIVPKE